MPMGISLSNGYQRIYIGQKAAAGTSGAGTEHNHKHDQRLERIRTEMAQTSDIRLTPLEQLKKKYGDRVHVLPPYHIERILYMQNECCRDLPVLLTYNRLPNGKKNYSCQCACNGWCTTGTDDPHEAISFYREMNARYCADGKSDYE